MTLTTDRLDAIAPPSEGLQEPQCAGKGGGKLPRPHKGESYATPTGGGAGSSCEYDLRLRTAILFKDPSLRPGCRLVSHTAGPRKSAGRGQAMATAEPSGHAARASTPGPGPGGVPGRVAGAAGAPSGRSGRRVPRVGERTPAAVEKRGPYMVMRVPSIQAKLRECGLMGVSAWAGCRVPRAGSGAPLGRPRRGTCCPLPKICSARVGSWRLGDTAEWGRLR